MKDTYKNIKLSPEAEMGGALEADPYSAPAEAYNTDFPLVAPGLKDLEIVTGEKAVSKKGSDMVVFKLKTTQEDVDTKGETLHAGFPLFHRITITETEDRPAARIAKDLALLLKAAGKPELSPRAVMDQPEVLVGCVVRAKVVVNKETDEYPESNGIKSFVLE